MNLLCLRRGNSTKAFEKTQAATGQNSGCGECKPTYPWGYIHVLQSRACMSDSPIAHSQSLTDCISAPWHSVCEPDQQPMRIRPHDRTREIRALYPNNTVFRCSIADIVSFPEFGPVLHRFQSSCPNGFQSYIRFYSVYICSLGGKVAMLSHLAVELDAVDSWRNSPVLRECLSAEPGV